MTSRLISRFIVVITIVAFMSGLFFSRSVTSAGKGDRSAPTAPTHLVVTAVTDTAVSLSWGPSTDNSGKFSYRVRISRSNNSAYNSLATVGQTNTSYTAQFLATNTSYRFSVYAVDANGNQSADSNIVSATTLADTTPPTTPVLEATVLSPSEIQLTWTQSTDDVPNNCCNYTFDMNGNPLTQNINWAYAPSGKLSAIIRHLTPGTDYSFRVSVSDWSGGGNVADSNIVDAVTDSSTDTTPPTVPTNLHLVRDGGCGEVWIGWTEATDNKDDSAYIEYEIYVNGALSPLPVSAGVDVDFVYATAFGDNIFTVKAVDRSGNSSAASSPLKLYLWPC
ncbi:MAG TPA: fibronectin type III domain-containing protein [Pyrinomonadaceae bacterium]|nr:fibronectin type III domain-containing protein [Pyrinomonadaceae bacterium]